MPASDRPSQYGFVQATNLFLGNTGQFQTETYTVGIDTNNGNIFIRSDAVVDKNNHFISANFTFPTR